MTRMLLLKWKNVKHVAIIIGTKRRQQLKVGLTKGVILGGKNQEV